MTDREDRIPSPTYYGQMLALADPSDQPEILTDILTNHCATQLDDTDLANVVTALCAPISLALANTTDRAYDAGHRAARSAITHQLGLGDLTK